MMKEAKGIEHSGWSTWFKHYKIRNLQFPMKNHHYSNTPALQGSIGIIIGTVLHMRLRSNDIFSGSDPRATRRIKKTAARFNGGLCSVTPHPM